MHPGGRSAHTIDAGEVLPHLTGILVRDGYAGCSSLGHVLHAWCAAHLLRDLRGIREAPDGYPSTTTRLLVTHQPNRQASTPRPPSPPRPSAHPGGNLTPGRAAHASPAGPAG
ncbi:transposase [Streptomyces sp. NPDC096030]|uniref:IS66 family transposase n=1 Tax=Streptomyces sp. NPDC096030 TaxID=3155423 RepID=UPI00331BD43E